MKVDPEILEKFLLDTSLVAAKDLNEAKEIAKKEEQDLGQILLSQGLISQDTLKRAEAYVLGISYVSLKDKYIDPEVLSLIPEPVARKYNIIAYHKDKDTLEVAMLDAQDLKAIDFVKKKTKLKVKPRLTDPESIKYALKLYQKSLKDELGDVIKSESKALEHLVDSQDEESEEDLKKAAEAVPAVRIVDSLLKHAISQGASDIHIEPQENEVIVRYRIDGILHDAMSLPKYAASAVVARIKVLSNLRIDEKRLPQDGRFRIKDPSGEKVAFRVSILPTYYGEKVVMRLLRENVRGFTLEALGFHGTGLERVHEATKKKTGLILVTGPTGSGKSTTLYTILDILNTNEVNISTVEDPIEYQMPRVNQTQVRPEIGFTFAMGLRSLVRQDPDIIMVGEIRDRETAELAVNAALTGHLVLSTLHTNSAAGAVPRLIDMGVEPFLISSVLQVVIGQRLVRVLCDDTEKYNLTRSEIDALSEIADLGAILNALKEEKVVEKNTTWKNIEFHRAKKTEKCPSGYKGRRGIQEVLQVDEAVKELILKNATSDEIEKHAKSQGMLTMLEDGIFKAAQGKTTLDEVLRVVSE